MVVALVLFWLPAMVVVLRREPGYFTTGVVWTALLATVALLVIGLGLAVLWHCTGTRRDPLLTADASGVRVPAGRGRPALDAAWTDLALVRVIGEREPELAFYLSPDAGRSRPEREPLDLSEPEYLRPLDFTNDPPPPTVAPERAVFAAITPLPEEEPPAQVSAPPRGSALYSTPFVVPLARTTPSRRVVLREIRRLADGRVPLA